MKLNELLGRLKIMYKESDGERFFTVLSFTSALLEKNGIDKNMRLINPDFEVINPDKIISDAKKILSGYPLQYYIGTEYFSGYEFKVAENVLIPRIDTEVLVNDAAENISKNAVFLDLCSGTGCVGISILKKRSDLFCISIDISPDAVRLTEENAHILETENRMKIICADVFSSEIEKLIKENNVSYIVSNPPYIKSAVIETLPENVKNEPRIALDGGNDGLDFYRRLLDICEKYNIPFSFEIGYDQREELSAECQKRGIGCRFIKDGGGNYRVVGKTLSK